MSQSSTPLTVVVPMRNEAAVLPRSLRELEAALVGLGVDFEMIAVDDGSTDSTADVLRAATAERTWLRSITLDPGQGKGAALATGFSAANGATIAFVDADMQIPGPEIGRLLAEALREPDVFFTGVRVGRRRTIPRWIMSRLYRLLSGAILGIWTRDVGCPLKAFPARMVASDAPTTVGWVIDAELLVMAHQHRIRVQEIPVAVGHDGREHSSVRVGDSLRCTRDLWRLRGRTRRHSREPA